MLVLSRKIDERIVIVPPKGKPITIQVTRLGPEKVRLGVDAPDDWIIDREEIWLDRAKGSDGAM